MLGAGGRRLLTAANAMIYLYLLAPILIVVPVSFSAAAFVVFPPRGLSLRWYANFLQSRELTEALWLSVRLGVTVMGAATVVGTMAALALVRYRVPGRELIRTFLMAPIVLPGVVLGIALLIFLARTPLAQTFGALFAAHLVVALPYVVRTVSASLEGLDRRVEEAAASLGAPPLLVFWTVTLPLVKPGVIAGAIFAFITSFDELVVSLFLTGPRLSTLPVQIYNYIEFASDPTIAAISVLLIALTTLAVLVVERAIGFTRLV
jgi:putative spermidine/putrescine transport system permease protein